MASAKEKLKSLCGADRVEKEENRSGQIFRASIIGIITNILLAAFKAIVGLASNSIAVILDAVNNLSDAASSLITIIGTRLAGLEPDKKHPFGHGRAEYLSASVISVIVLYAGLTSLIESIKKILSPEAPSYSGVTLFIIAVAVVTKILLGTYVKRVGVKTNSDSLVASGTDALMDSIISASTLLAAIIFVFTGISLEAWLGALISLLIIKSGYELLRDTLSRILGESVNADLVGQIKATVVANFREVSGVYDVVLNDYGPDRYTGSIHVEVPAAYTATQIDVLIRRISSIVYHEHNVILTAISVYPLNPEGSRQREIEMQIREIAMSHENVLQLHGFSLDEEEKTIRFDVVISFDEKDRRALTEHITADVQALYPAYQIFAALDVDYSEI